MRFSILIFGSYISKHMHHKHNMVQHVESSDVSKMKGFQTYQSFILTSRNIFFQLNAIMQTLKFAETLNPLLAAPKHC
jgi:hypothetical protein